MNLSELRCECLMERRIKRSFMYRVNNGLTLSPFMHRSWHRFLLCSLPCFLKIYLYKLLQMEFIHSHRTHSSTCVCVAIQNLQCQNVFPLTSAFAYSLRVQCGCLAYPCVPFVLLLTFISSVYTMSLSYFPLHLHFMFVLLRQTAKMFAWYISVVCVFQQRKKEISHLILMAPIRVCHELCANTQNFAQRM